MRWVIALLLLLSRTQAEAGLTTAQLRSVTASPARGAHLDLSLVARDEQGRTRSLGAILGGRPTFLVFVDYTCNTLCGTELLFLGAAIERAKLPRGDARIIAFGMNPKDGPKTARAMEREEIPANLRAQATLLSPDKATIARATSALGFRYLYDPSIDQFAHPAVVYAIAGDGKMLAMLSPFALMTTDLAAALHESGPRETLLQRVWTICYHLAPLQGIYDAGVLRLLAAGAATTLALLAGALMILVARARKSS